MAEITIADVICPACSETFDLEGFDPEQDLNETECPECGAELEASEYDPTAGTVVLLELVDEDESEDDGEDADLIQDDEDDADETE